MMDESNDKTDKSCIILIRSLNHEVGEVQTSFIDMPVVNVGTAKHLYDALKLSLTNKGLDFSNCVAFMSETTGVMKGSTRSVVQKLITNECLIRIYDVECICHLADLTIKAGVQTFRVDIDQLFVDIFFFYHSSKLKQIFADNW